MDAAAAGEEDAAAADEEDAAPEADAGAVNLMEVMSGIESLSMRTSPSRSDSNSLFE